MSSAATVPLSEYFRTLYRPDCDYVDGEVRERHAGELPHSRMMAELGYYLVDHEKEWAIIVLMSVRVQVSPTRIRVPDLAALPQNMPKTRIVEAPPLLCVEILSPDDRMSSMQERVDDYLAFGVPCIWVVNPQTRRGFVYTSEGMREAKHGILRVAETPIEVPLLNLG
jgi:Uma2 family endonuclease